MPTATQRMIRAVLALAMAGFLPAAPAVGRRAEDPTTDECNPHEEGKDLLCGFAASQISRFQMEQAVPRILSPDSADTDVTHCFLNIEIDPVTKAIAGSNTIDVTSQVDGLAQLQLDLHSSMTVDSVSINGAIALYTRPADQILVNLDRTYNTGESCQVAVVYHGVPQDIGISSFDFGSHGSSATPVAASLSEPWYAYTWWPCKESLVDKFTADIWVTAPGWMVVASNGSLEGTDTLAGNRKRYRWHEGHPIAVYLVSVTASDYVTWTDTYTYTGGSMPVQFYIYPEQLASVQPQLANVVTAIATFSQPGVYGQYPFVDEKYGIVQFNWGGGMEHQTITSQGAFAEYLTVHELSHQWWGDMITCKTWHDIWLNEGFATYSEAVWQEKKPGGSMPAYRAQLQSRRPWNFAGTVYCYDATSVNNIFSTNNSYNKGAWVLHMLRHVLGDQAFFDTLLAYRAAFAGGTADTADFRSIAEQVSGRDLGWFFTEWVYNGGAPSYRYGWQQQQIGSQNWVRLHVQQYQSTYPMFTMPIDITVNTPTGSETRSVWHAVTTEWYVLPADGPVTSLTLDRDTWILRGNAAATTYLNGPPKILRTAPDPGALLSPSAESVSVEIQFSEPVSCSSADFTVTGSRTGLQPFTLSYVPSSYLVTLTLGGPLDGGQTWTLRAADTIRSQAAAVALDGEVANPQDPAALPSGEGLPGGAAVLSFFVASPSDFDLNGEVDEGDFLAFQSCGSGPSIHYSDDCSKADLDHDEDVDMDDFGILQRSFTGPG